MSWPTFTQFDRESCLVAGRGVIEDGEIKTQILISRGRSNFHVIAYAPDWIGAGAEALRGDRNLFPSHRDPEKFFNIGEQIPGLQRQYGSLEEVIASLISFGFDNHEVDAIVAYSRRRRSLPKR
jgi:hypothetical protein